MKAEAKGDHSIREGHGDTTQNNQSLSKGKYMQVGSACDLSTEKAYSPNVKTGTMSGTSEK